MRKNLLLVFLLVFCFGAYSQVDMSLGYELQVPTQTMAKHIQPAHGAQMGVYFQPLKKYKQFWAGVEAGIGSYARKTIEQTFTFTDGTTTRTDVRYNSNIAYGKLAIRYDVPLKGRFVPYASVGGGLTNFYTGIYIEDPNDPLGCKALEKDLAFKDYTFIYSYGAGARINISKKGKGDVYWIDLSVFGTRGGDIEYLNVKHLGDHQHEEPADSESKPFNTKFINVNTQDIHEHQLTRVYNSAVNLVNFKLSLFMRFNGL